jgi:hypothetical protein
MISWFKPLIILIALLALAVGSTPSRATSISYGGSGSGSDGALSATADFTTGNGTLTVTLTNQLGAGVIRSAGQALSDIQFTLSNNAGALGSTSASGQLGNVSGSGVVTYVSGDPTRWLGVGGGQFTINGNSILMEVIGGGQPSQMIAPAIANGGTYGNVNQGFGNFSPYVIGPATFTLGLAGVTADTTITSATFSFGTSPDTFIDGTVIHHPVVPEPSTLALSLIGLGSLGLARLRGRSRRQPAAV